MVCDRPLKMLQVPVPQNRLTPLKESWMKLYQPVTEHMQLDMRMNLKTKRVRLLQQHVLTRTHV